MTAVGDAASPSTCRVVLSDIGSPQPVILLFEDVACIAPGRILPDITGTDGTRIPGTWIGQSMSQRKTQLGFNIVMQRFRTCTVSAGFTRDSRCSRRTLLMLFPAIQGVDVRDQTES
jgi:hypothetical protein